MSLREWVYGLKGEVVMNIFYFIGIVIIFCILQFILLTKINNAFIKYLLVQQQ